MKADIVPRGYEWVNTSELDLCPSWLMKATEGTACGKHCHFKGKTSCFKSILPMPIWFLTFPFWKAALNNHDSSEESWIEMHYWFLSSCNPDYKTQLEERTVLCWLYGLFTGFLKVKSTELKTNELDTDGPDLSCILAQGWLLYNKIKVKANL